MLCIAGESGSGKSTLLQTLAFELRPDAGSVRYDLRGEGLTDLARLPDASLRELWRTDWGFVRQNPRDGLRMRVSAGANIGERLMAIG